MHLVPAPAVRLMKEPLVSDAGTKRTKERKVRTRRLEEMMRLDRTFLFVPASCSLVNRHVLQVLGARQKKIKEMPRALDLVLMA